MIPLGTPAPWFRTLTHGKCWWRQQQRKGADHTIDASDGPRDDCRHHSAMHSHAGRLHRRTHFPCSLWRQLQDGYAAAPHWSPAIPRKLSVWCLDPEGIPMESRLGAEEENSKRKRTSTWTQFVRQVLLCASSTLIADVSSSTIRTCVERVP